MHRKTHLLNESLKLSSIESSYLSATKRWDRPQSVLDTNPRAYVVLPQQNVMKSGKNSKTTVLKNFAHHGKMRLAMESPKLMPMKRVDLDYMHNSESTALPNLQSSLVSVSMLGNKTLAQLPLAKNKFNRSII